MSAMASQITGVSIVYSTFCSGTDQRKHQWSASLASGEFPAERASNAENVSIWWRHHDAMSHDLYIWIWTPARLFKLRTDAWVCIIGSTLIIRIPYDVPQRHIVQMLLIMLLWWCASWQIPHCKSGRSSENYIIFTNAKCTIRWPFCHEPLLCSHIWKIRHMWWSI